ncbi:MAG TPA: amidohydrolase [Syntrophothermus lipocalidus]|nr:amidohydrolase [Syntrophothermus lipocalidus]HOV43037.1 amidohydrolase [Syntrophothermus lipocalidus]
MLAIRGGRVYTMSAAGVLNNATVLIDGDRIKAVGFDVEIPAGCEVIEAADKHVCPGLIDAHCHLGLEEEVYRVEGDDLNETTDPLTPYLMALDGINFWDIGFTDAVRAGVTTVLVLPGSANVIGGQAALLKTWGPRPLDMVYRSSWGLKAALGENPKRVYGSQNKAPRTRMASAAMLREAFYVAAKSLDQPKDLKAKDEFEQMPLGKVLQRKMPLYIHVHRADDILTALRLKDEFGIDMVIQHGTEAFMVADELAARGVKVALGPLLVNRAKVELKEVSFRNARRLHEAGVEFCFITDHPVIPIQYLSVCAGLAVREGLDEEVAMAAITSRAAVILGMQDEIGTIEEGKKADIVIFSHHPLEIKARAEAVLVGGRLWRDTCHG